MINGYKIAKVRELHGLNNYQCFMVGAVKEWEGTAKMTITQLMGIAKLSKIGCHATIHKALMESIGGGFLKVEPSKRDGRIKFLSITKKSEQYLNDLNKGAGK
jgi:hypothetical protein